MTRKYDLKPMIAIAILCLISAVNLFGQDSSQNFITSDIGNFWNAYDKITATTDGAEQLKYINALFIEKGSPGLKAMMQAREYTAQSYVDAINKYPLFWKSIRPNTLKAGALAKDIALDVDKIKTVYPNLKPAKIYFTIGALRSGGTTLDGMVLIGSELALADTSTIATEFPKEFKNIPAFFATNPITNIVHTNVHEYVHTQQKTTVGNNLLAQSVIEGVAEFVTNMATGRKSWAESFSYGRQHDKNIREAFVSQMFNPFNGFWLYSNADNKFDNVRDLGYYVGYAVCERYYEKAADKKQAIREMIELDYNDEPALEKFVESAGYFAQPLGELRGQFEKNRPTVVSIKEFKNGDKNVDPAITQITVEFSAGMNTQFRNFELGPLGADNLLRVKKFIGFSEDGKSMRFEIQMQPDRQYQLLIGDGFRDENDVSLRPYLIDFKTAAK